MEVRIEIGCKINLFLHVTGRRSDGYHTLETLFLPLPEPSDTLTLEFDAMSGIRLSTDAALPTGNGNLAYRAAERYAAESGMAPAWSIALEKRIPAAAGLGGGSADAAGVLKVLEAHYRKLGKKRLREVALGLGADVPFFLDPVPATARGVGEELAPLAGPLPPLHLVLANPGFPVSARWAYGQLPEHSEHPGTLDGLLRALETGDQDGIARNIRNDLAPALWRKFPLLTVLKERLSKRGAFAVEVSGSGPTLFALFDDQVSAERAARELNAGYSEFGFFAVEAR